MSHLDKLHVEWKDHILYITIATADRRILDRLPELVWSKVEGYNFSKPILIFTDHSAGMVTPYLRTVLAQVFAPYPPTLHGRSAVLVPKSVLGNALQIIANEFFRSNMPQLERKFFLERETALAWLKEIS